MFDTIKSTIDVFPKMRLKPWASLGDVLLVGEGNMSFAKSLLAMPVTQITHMTATTFEKKKDLSHDVIKNANFLKRIGVLVMHGVDATKLEKSFKPHAFDTIIFQFPNVGSRDTKYGHNPNHVMIRKFLRSAKPYLKLSGKIIISVVDNPHYNGVFQLEEAAAFAGYEAPETYSFDPHVFSGYFHTNTNDEKSALEDHNKFLTWVFRPKNEFTIRH